MTEKKNKRLEIRINDCDPKVKDFVDREAAINLRKPGKQAEYMLKEYIRLTKKQ